MRAVGTKKPNSEMPKSLNAPTLNSQVPKRSWNWSDHTGPRANTCTAVQSSWRSSHRTKPEKSTTRSAHAHARMTAGSTRRRRNAGRMFTAKGVDDGALRGASIQARPELPEACRAFKAPRAARPRASRSRQNRRRSRGAGSSRGAGVGASLRVYTGGTLPYGRSAHGPHAGAGSDVFRRHSAVSRLRGDED